MFPRIGMAVAVACTLAAAALWLSPSIQAQEKSGGTKVTAEEMKSLFANSVQTGGVGTGMVIYSNLFAKGGTFYQLYTCTAHSCAGGVRQGTWHLDGDKVCFSVAEFSPASCHDWYRLANGSYESRSDNWQTLDGTFSILTEH